MWNQPKQTPKQELLAGTSMSVARSTSVHELEAPWISAVTKLGLSTENVRPVFVELIDLYTQEGRAYHNLTHLQAVLGFIREHSIEFVNLPQVTLAVFFHDAIYDSKAKDNEERSAALVRARMEVLGLQQKDVQDISSLVLSTKKHQPLLPGPDNKLFLDADLSILGAPSEVYLQYCRAIRHEYSWVPEREYIAGRREVLESFFKRDEIYFSSSARSELEAQARENIAGEIKQLASSE